MHAVGRHLRHQYLKELVRFRFLKELGYLYLIDDGNRDLAKIRVLLADDHEDMLEIISRLLEPEFEIVGTATNGKALITAAKETGPSVVVADISMPIINGIEAAKILRASDPEMQIVFLTIHDTSDYVQAALATGALGYVVKARLASDLSIAIKSAYAGRPYLSPSISSLPGN